jgi:hypothetical protein
LLGAVAAQVGSLPRPRPPGWAAQTAPTRAHCPPSVAAGRWGIEVRLERWNLACCWGGPSGLPVQLVPARGRSAGARPDSGGLRPLGMAPGRRRGAPKTAERRAASLGRRCPSFTCSYLEARLSGRLDEAREYRSVRFQERMELIEAVKKQDVVKVKVRRPLEAVTSTESGPSRGVCLGLGQWTLDAVVARPIRPCCAESSSYVRHQSGNCDAACRRSSVPVTTSPSVTRTLPCRLAESRNFSPPPSPAIAVPATF